jgi:hypothetical protein
VEKAVDLNNQLHGRYLDQEKGHRDTEAAFQRIAGAAAAVAALEAELAETAGAAAAARVSAAALKNLVWGPDVLTGALFWTGYLNSAAIRRATDIPTEIVAHWFLGGELELSKLKNILNPDQERRIKDEYFRLAGYPDFYLINRADTLRKMEVLDADQAAELYAALLRLQGLSNPERAGNEMVIRWKEREQILFPSEVLARLEEETRQRLLLEKAKLALLLAGTVAWGSQGADSPLAAPASADP